MSGPSVYLETTVISYLTARPSRNLRVVAHQEITADWWTRRRMSFELYVSRLVRGRLRCIRLRSAGDLHSRRVVGGLIWWSRMTAVTMILSMKSSRKFVPSAGLTPPPSDSTSPALWRT